VKVSTRAIGAIASAPSRGVDARARGARAVRVRLPRIRR